MMKSFKTLIYQGLYAIYLFSALQIIQLSTNILGVDWGLFWGQIIICRGQTHPLYFT